MNHGKMKERELEQGAGYMSLRHFMNKYFSNQQETKDKHWDQLLKTRYYKVTKEEGFETLKNMVENSPDFEMNAISKEHGELSFYIKGRKIFIVATVIMIRPYQTAIDFAATFEGLIPFDFGYSRRLISQLYERLNKELTPIK